MTRILLELKDDRQVFLLRAILRFLNIPIVKEEKEQETQDGDPASFYNQFQIDMSTFHFDRQEANER